MIKEAIEKIITMVPGAIIKDEFGRQIWDKTGITLGDPVWPQLQLRSLTSLVDYINEVHAEFPTGSFIHVPTPTKIALRGPVTEMKKEFDMYATVLCDRTPFRFNSFLDIESFIISLQTMFVETEARNDLLEIVGNLTDDTSVRTQDDGFSQEVTVRTGITKSSFKKLPNPVLLQPYRTFEETEQPWSSYVFRMNKDCGVACALFDVGDNSWERVAVRNICAHLRNSIVRDIPIIG